MQPRPGEVRRASDGGRGKVKREMSERKQRVIKGRKTNQTQIGPKTEIVARSGFVHGPWQL